MNGLRGHYAKWNKSHREREIPHDLIYMWILKTKQNKNRHIDTGNQWVVARRAGRGW